MKLGTLIILTWLAQLSFSLAGPIGGPAPIVVKTGEAQLFVDDFLIHSQTHLMRTLHQPKKDNGGNFPVIELKDEFVNRPATLEANGTIVYDPKLKKYVMFVLAFCPPNTGAERAHNYRFTSTDGFSWTRGDDGA